MDHLETHRSTEGFNIRTTETSSKNKSLKDPSAIHMEWEDHLLDRPIVFEISEYENTLKNKLTYYVV